jgi:hypothetical protein
MNFNIPEKYKSHEPGENIFQIALDLLEVNPGAVLWHRRDALGNYTAQLQIFLDGTATVYDIASRSQVAAREFTKRNNFIKSAAFTPGGVIRHLEVTKSPGPWVDIDLNIFNLKLPSTNTNEMPNA